VGQVAEYIGHQRGVVVDRNMRNAIYQRLVAGKATWERRDTTSRRDKAVFYLRGTRPNAPRQRASTTPAPAATPAPAPVGGGAHGRTAGGGGAAGELVEPSVPLSVPDFGGRGDRVLIDACVLEGHPTCIDCGAPPPVSLFPHR
jgi:hypothetical protein